MNTSVDPCENFYDFACQRWGDENPPPNFQDIWSEMTIRIHEAYHEMREIPSTPTSTNELSALSTAKRYFQACTKPESFDEARIRRHIKLILSKLEEYGGWPILYQNGTWNSSQIDWMTTVASLKNEFDLTYVLEVKAVQSVDGNVSNNFIAICTPELDFDLEGLENEHKPLSEDNFSTFASTFADVAKEILLKYGNTTVDEKLIRQKAKEMDILNKYISALDKTETGGLKCGLQSKPDTTIERFQEKLDASLTTSKGIDLLKLLNTLYTDTGIILKKTQPVAAGDLQYFVQISNLINNTSTEALANYLLYQMTSEMFLFVILFAPGNSSGVSQEIDKMKSLQRRRNSLLETSKKIESMYSNISNALLELATNAKNPTINSTLLVQKILGTRMCSGYQNWIQLNNSIQSKYAGLDLNATYQASTGFLEQSILVHKWKAKYDLSLLRKPYISAECIPIAFSPEVLGPHYISTTDSIHIPVGYMRPPFIHKNLPEFLNYAKLGAQIGHEIGHALAGPGLFDLGNETKPRVAKCLISQYSNYRELNENLDGLLTLEENLADNAGLLAAYKAYKMSSVSERPQKLKGLEQYTNDQLFFLGFAQTWCTFPSEQAQRWLLNIDKHSPAKSRVFGSLQNSEEFAKAWSCPIGS